MRKFLAHIFTLTSLADDFFCTVLRDAHGDGKSLTTIVANVLINGHKHLLGVGEKIIIRHSLISTDAKKILACKQTGHTHAALTGTAKSLAGQEIQSNLMLSL